MIMVVSLALALAVIIVYVYVYVYVWVDVWVYVWVDVWVYVCVYICVCIYVGVCMCVCMCMYVCVCVCMYPQFCSEPRSNGRRVTGTTVVSCALVGVGHSHSPSGVVWCAWRVCIGDAPGFGSIRDACQLVFLGRYECIRNGWSTRASVVRGEKRAQRDVLSQRESDGTFVNLGRIYIHLRTQGPFKISHPPMLTTGHWPFPRRWNQWLWWPLYMWWVGGSDAW